MTDITYLSEVTKEDIETAGGKGANLGELIKEGFPVPPGFIINAGVYNTFIGALALPDVITDCSKFRASILKQEIPPGLNDSILSHHNTLTGHKGSELIYAVRSSATAEDLGDASFAGQHETYYYVSVPNLPLMIKKCWASLWSDAAFSYRQSQGIEHGAVNMAVVIQEMVQSETSGVTFTANPVTGDREQIITEASWGMGAAIVDGRVSPDRYIINKTNGNLVSKRIADKKFMVPASVRESESRLVPVPAALRRKETLSQKQIDTITLWAKKSEAYFGSEQDLEWAFEKNRFYILQSRPITVLGQKEDEIPKGQYVLFKPFAENFTDPLLPLSQDILNRLFPMMVFIKGRVYMNLKHIRPLFPLKISNDEIASLAYLSSIEGFKLRLSIPRLVLLTLILGISYLLTGILFKRTTNMPNDFMHSFRALVDRVVADEKINPPEALMTLFLKPRFFAPVGNMPFMVNLSAPRYMGLLAILSFVLKRWIPGIREDAASYLTSGTDGILSTDMGREIWLLAKHARTCPEVKSTIKNLEPDAALAKLKQIPAAQSFMLQLGQFLEVHGHRTLKEFELNSVRWEEDPAPIIAMIKNYLQSDANPDQTESRVKQGRVEFAEEVKLKLETKPFEKMFHLRWRFLQFLRDQAKYFIRLRENSRFYHIMGFYAVRKKILKIEAELIRQGKLKCKDDIYYLRWEEIEQLQSGAIAWQDIEELLRERRMDFIRLSKVSPRKTYGIEIPVSTNQESNQLGGQGASPGIYQGIARVIMDPAADAELHPGEILVAPYTDPAWTPLFLTASAAVVEVGSYLSHAGTIAREYCMPCVVDAEECTHLIKSGDVIRVDGTTGSVTLIIEDNIKNKTGDKING